jgi:hypothetical protein
MFLSKNTIKSSIYDFERKIKFINKLIKPRKYATTRPSTSDMNKVCVKGIGVVDVTFNTRTKYF